MRVVSGMLLLVWIPLAVAKNDKEYPKEKIAEFIVEKLDVTSMPSAIRPRHEKGKKTFGDYGYITRKLDDREALVEAPQGGSQIDINILEENKSGIYVCLNNRPQKQNQIQRVFLLKVKNSNGLLKGRASWKEFDSCPVIGGADSDSAGDGYGGG